MNNARNTICTTIRTTILLIHYSKTVPVHAKMAHYTRATLFFQ